MTDRAHLRRVLVVAYYFPPMGLSGVQRTAKFVRYLGHYGWQPEVLTVEPGGYFAYDPSLLEEVEAAGVPIHRTRSLDPTQVFGRRTTVPVPAEPARQRLAAWSHWAFIPDNKLGWLPFAVSKGLRLHQHRRFDALFATAPPYTSLLVAARLQRMTGLPLVLDFRDDWLGNPRHVYPTPVHRWLHRHLERRAVQASQQLVAINPPIAEALRQRHPDGPPVHLLPQGFDPADFAAPSRSPDRQKMRLVYTGVFYDVQTPDPFLHGLARFLDRHPAARPDLEAVFVGLLPAASQHLAAALNLSEVVRYEGYRSHRDAVAWQQAADVLWMTIGRRRGAEGISTGKLYEYFGARKPILALVPEGTARDDLQSYGAAQVVEPDDVPGIGAALEALYHAWQHGRLPVPEEAFVQRFDRLRLTGELAALLTALVSPETHPGST
jgi:hypothetical protein